jgi:hypothetical protein
VHGSGKQSRGSHGLGDACLSLQFQQTLQLEGAVWAADDPFAPAFLVAARVGAPDRDWTEHANSRRRLRCRSGERRADASMAASACPDQG